MTDDDYIYISLGAIPIEDGCYIDRDEDKYFIIKSIKDITNFKNQNSDYIGYCYYSIHYLSDEEIRKGRTPEVITIYQEENIQFNNDSIIVMMLKL